MPHDNDGHEQEHCPDCGKHMMLDRLKWAVHEEIIMLEDLLHEIRAGQVTNVRLREGVLEEEVIGPLDYEWDTLPGGR